MKRRLARGATAGLGLVVLLTGVWAPRSNAQDVCVWVSVRVLGGTPSTVKVELDDLCPDTLPPADTVHPCGTFVQPYLDPNINDSVLDVKVLACVEFP